MTDRETLILGIDTSCDDTSAAVVKTGREILSNVVSSQAGIHSRFGGIVPELASRSHIVMIWPVVTEALEIAGVTPEDLSGIAVCIGPGLVGSLLVGCCFAKALSYAKGIPLLGINHIEGHIYSAFLGEQEPPYPFLSLVVSGGHTTLIRVDAFGRYREIGSTRDDAAGEAYDKVAKLLGLGYPGGPAIDSLSGEGNPEAIRLPRPLLTKGYDFSFSGLKTAVRNVTAKLRESNTLNEETVKDICASFQRAVVDVLVKKTIAALKKEGLRELTISGGVSANRELREFFKKMCQTSGITLYLPPGELCTDNAAMIAASGHLHLIKGNLAGLDLNARAYLPICSNKDESNIPGL